MATQENIKRRSADEDAPDPSAGTSGELAPSDDTNVEVADAPDAHDGVEASSSSPDQEFDPPAAVASPSQLGTRRFVYAAYLGAAIAIAFLSSKALEMVWLRVQSWKPIVGEPRDEVLMPVAALIGAGAALYYWRYTRARELAEEVASEMSKVTWPTRAEVTNGTVIVIVTTLVSTVFFALMDKFWGFVTNLVYGGT